MESKKLDPTSLKSELADDQVRRPHDLTPEGKFIAKVKGMLVGTEYEYAEMTLRGILDTAERRGVVTEAMRTAVDNIAEKPHRGTSRDRWRGGW